VEESIRIFDQRQDESGILDKENKYAHKGLGYEETIFGRIL
jgi:hypothetical protein